MEGQFLTTAQLVVFLGIIAAIVVVEAIGYFAAASGDLVKSRRCTKAMMLLLLLAVGLVALSVAKNHNLDPWSLVQ